LTYITEFITAINVQYVLLADIAPLHKDKLQFVFRGTFSLISFSKSLNNITNIQQDL